MASGAQSVRDAAVAAGRGIAQAVPRIGELAGKVAGRAGELAGRVAESAAGRVAAKVAEHEAVRTGGRVAGEAASRFVPGMNAAIAGMDVYDAVQTQRDPSASTAQKALAWTTAAGSVVAATDIPVVSQVGAIGATASDLASIFVA